MTKPIGYYCSVTPGDGSYLDNLQSRYGSTFEELTKLQKLYILSALISNLTHAHLKTTGNTASTKEVNAITSLVGEFKQHLSINEHLSLADAIVNQLKYQR